MSAGKKIKQSFLAKKKRKTKQKPVLRPLDKYREVLLFTSSYDQKLYELASQTFPNAKCSFCYPRDEKKEDPTVNDFTYHLSDVNLTGKIKNDKLIHLVQIPFDLVLDLSPEGEINYFLLNEMNQSFMVGRSENNRALMYNLILPEELNDSEIIKLVKKQITLLSQNGTK